MGPSLGGLIVSSLGWRWTFYFYVPATVAILSLAFWLLPLKRIERGPWFDLAGALVLVTALMGAAPRQQQGAAGAIMAEARVLGMFTGVALATAIFQAAGGRTGAPWRAAEFDAMHLALLAGSIVALLGALAASLRGRMTAPAR